MAHTQDYMTIYSQFFEEFAATVNPNDQLPVKVAAYYLCETELVGEIVDWTLQYLSQKRCPSSLVAPITRLVIEETKLACRKEPIACGYRPAENTFQPLKLMQMVTAKVNEICQRYRDNGKMATLPPPSPGPPISSCAIKNTRRRMEDRHVIIEDFHTVFNIQDRSPTSYYAIFDGHAGTDAATYSVSHLHQFLAESSFYPTDPVRALKDAFFRTDALFVEKSNRENLRSGTTAVCALLRPKEKMLYVAWLGDSQALLVRRGQAVQVVNPHKPDRQDERDRIEHMGGVVLYWGTWRVNGQLAVSRAIGDLEYKPYVTAEPDVTAIPLDGSEDFLVLACDGLWDFVTENEAVQAVYNQVREAPGDLEAVSQILVQLSKQQGSTDNISVIVVFLTEPAQLASRRATCLNNGPSETSSNPQTMETSFDNSNNPTGGGSNPFLATPNGPESVPYQKSGLLLDGGFKQNGTSPSATDLYFLDRPNGKENNHHHHHYEDDDFGPETDVDAVDDVLLSPTKVSSERDSVNEEEEQKRRLEADLELQRQQMSDFDPVQERREETPTPPADDVPGVGNLVPEADNVAESGDDSEEDEWDYFRVDPKDHSGAGAEQQKQSEEPICDKPAQPEGEEVDDSMSQLNPNAAEFVPSPTQMMPTMNDILLAESPRKGGVPMEDIRVPSQNEFQEEVRLRPSEMDLETDSPTSPKAKGDGFFPDVVNKEVSNYRESDVAEKNIHNLEFKEFLDQQEISYQAGKDVLRTEQKQEHNLKEMIDTMSELSSTRAECGDDSSVSFMTSGSELQKTITENVSSFSIMNKSFTEQEYAGSDLSLSVSKNDQTTNELDDKEFSYMSENDIQNDLMKNLDEVPPMSFEVHKEVVPEMEAQPERVQLSEGTSSFEQDETSSPLIPEETKFDENALPPMTFETDEKQLTASETEEFEQNLLEENKTLEEAMKSLSVNAKEFEPTEFNHVLESELIQGKTEDILSKEYTEPNIHLQNEMDIQQEELEFITKNVETGNKEFEIESDFIEIKKTEVTNENMFDESKETEVEVEKGKETEAVEEKDALESTEFEIMKEKIDVTEFEAVQEKNVDAFEAFEQKSQTYDFEVLEQKSRTDDFEALEQKSRTDDFEALEQKSRTDEFEALEQKSRTDEFEAFEQKSRTDEFEAFEQKSRTDEFEAFEQKSRTDEFEAFEQKSRTDEFEALEQKSSTDEFGVEEKCEQNKTPELESETTFARIEEDFVLDDKLSSPMSPSLKVGSPIPDMYTATSTPETVPIEKVVSPLAGESHDIPEISSPQPELMSPNREVNSPISLENEIVIIRKSPAEIFEHYGSSQMPEKALEELEPLETQRIVEDHVPVEDNIPDIKSESPCLVQNDAKSPEPLKEIPVLEPEADVNETCPVVEEDIALTHTPPPTPAHISEEALQETLAAVSPEPQQLSEAAEKLAEKVGELESEKVEDAAIVAVAAVTVGAAAIGAATLASEVKQTEEIKSKVEEKKEPTAEVKKTTIKDKKTPSSKPPAKASPATKTTTAKAPSKPATSPTKTPARTATPRKSAPPSTTTTTPTRAAPKTTLAPASKPKAATPLSRPLPTAAKSASPAPRPRPASATSKPLTNGEVKPAAKRPEPLAMKKPATTTTAKPSRPASAPVAARTTTTTTKIGTKTTTATTTAPKPKPATTMNGTANRPRPAGMVATTTARAKTLDKQVKETANKQISNRTTTTNAATKTANTLASTRTITATATKKTVGPVKSTVTNTATTKMNTTGKVGVKKAGSTTTTRVTATKTVNKTAASVTSTVSEVIKVQQIVTEAKD